MTSEKFFSTLTEVENNTIWREVAPFQLRISPISCTNDFAAIDQRQYEISVDNTTIEIPQGFETSIFMRAQIYGNALQVLPTEDVANVVNKALSLRPRNERYKMLLRGGKCFAVHSEMYSPISQKWIYTVTEDYLKNLFDGEFINGEYNDYFTIGIFELKSPKLIKVYEDAFRQIGREHFFKSFVVKVITSDVSVSGANIYLFGKTSSNAVLPFGKILTKHSGKNKKSIYANNLSQIFPLLEKKAEVMSELSNLEIAHPCNVLIQLFKKLKFSKKISTKIHEQYTTFQGDNVDTAINIFFEICSYLFEMKKSGATEMQIIDASEKISLLTINDFKNADLPGIFAWEA